MLRFIYRIFGHIRMLFDVMAERTLMTSTIRTLRIVVRWINRFLFLIGIVTFRGSRIFLASGIYFILVYFRSTQYGMCIRLITGEFLSPQDGFRLFLSLSQEIGNLAGFHFIRRYCHRGNCRLHFICQVNSCIYTLRLQVVCIFYRHLIWSYRGHICRNPVGITAYDFTTVEAIHYLVISLIA